MNRLRRLAHLAFAVLACAPAQLLAQSVHWRDALRQPAEWYATPEAAALATSVLAYQMPSGGWPKNTDFSRPPSDQFLADLRAGKDSATIDNNGTTVPLRFLAKIISARASLESSAAEATPFEASARKGFDYLLDSQYPSGGWPQFFPLREGYYSHITYNDNAMVNALALLHEASAALPPFAFLDAPRRTRATASVTRGIDCILRTQVVQNGARTAWCAQHDARTLAPAWARAFEPPSLSGQESVGITRFLMSIESPSPAIIAAVEGAAAWFQKTQITGLRYETFTADDGRPDRRVVPDPSAPPLWARFYELETDRPLFLGRDREFHHDYTLVERERRVGYAYYTTQPADLLARDYPRWHASLPADAPADLLVPGHASLQPASDSENPSDSEESGMGVPPMIPPPDAPDAPDATVAADGTGNYTSLEEAIAKAPLRTGVSAPRWVIHVRPGTYRERVHVQRERGHILVRGDDAATTIITFDLHAKLPDPAFPGDPTKTLGTFRTPTVQIDGDGMIWENITFANTAGPVAQALALRADGDRLVFRRCRFLGWQDTLLLNRGRHYFEDCTIEGSVDFIFGSATAYFSRCHLHVLRDGCITAASTPEGAAHGFVFADCRVTTVPEATKGVYFGRPWRNFARTIFLRTELAGNIHAEGWHNWNYPAAERTTYYAEHASTGPGANPAARVSWARILTATEAAALTPRAVLSAPDAWDPTAP